MSRMIGILHKEIESLPQTQIFKSLYLCNLMMLTFDISNKDYFVQQNSQFDISKIYTIGLQKYRDQKIRFCYKNSVSFLYKYFYFKNGNNCNLGNQEPKKLRFLPQTLIFKSLYLCNPMKQNYDISNYEFCQIIFSIYLHIHILIFLSSHP